MVSNRVKLILAKDALDMYGEDYIRHVNSIAAWKPPSCSLEKVGPRTPPRGHMYGDTIFGASQSHPHDVCRNFCTGKKPHTPACVLICENAHTSRVTPRLNKLHNCFNLESGLMGSLKWNGGGD